MAENNELLSTNLENDHTDAQGYIKSGLRADIMRKMMENKNLLKTKGSIYVGTGDSSKGPTCALNPHDEDIGKPLIYTGIVNGLCYSSLSDNAFVENTINGNKLKDNTINGNKLAANSVTGQKLVEKTITGSLIANDTITKNKLQNYIVDLDSFGQEDWTIFNGIANLTEQFANKKGVFLLKTRVKCFKDADVPSSLEYEYFSVDTIIQKYNSDSTISSNSATKSFQIRHYKNSEHTTTEEQFRVVWEFNSRTGECSYQPFITSKDGVQRPATYVGDNLHLEFKIKQIS